MDSWEVLPQVALQSVEPLSAEIIARGIPDFRAVGRYLHGLSCAKGKGHAAPTASSVRCAPASGSR
jgi:hypothetical protein